jgi:thiol-disulfide isomerase/thioredoxin
MSATPSNMMPLGTQAPYFELIEPLSGSMLKLTTLKGSHGTLILFICNHCPYVLHIKQQLIDIATVYARQGINTIAICANDSINYPQDAPDKMVELITEWGHPFTAYLYDESQNTAKAYQAACTPDIYLFDKMLKCVYRGRLDQSTPKNNQPLTGKELRAALDNLLTDQPINTLQHPSIGCNIKWQQNS